MHIAICDDHVTDRKHLERLMRRESDNRIETTGVLYIDSFGSSESALNAPLMYDAFFIDMTNSAINGIELSERLRGAGVTAPIVFCSSSVNYREAAGLLPPFYFLDKPFIKDELSEMVDLLVEFTSKRVAKMEFRCKEETFYLSEPDILYAVVKGEIARIHTKDGRVLTAALSLDTMISDLARYESFFLANRNTIVNSRYITNISFFTVTMTNQKKIKIIPSMRHHIETWVQDTKKQV